MTNEENAIMGETKPKTDSTTFVSDKTTEKTGRIAEQPRNAGQTTPVSGGLKEKVVPLVQQYHPCTWCGGQRVQIREGSGEEVVVGMVIPVVSLEGKKNPMYACVKCVLKVFNNMLGQARFYGIEMAQLKKEVPNKGFFPLKKQVL